MELPKLINNINERVVDDLKNRLSAKSKVSIAAASFSIYAFEALKNELEEIEDLRFIFTSPTFVKINRKKRKGSFIFQNLIENATYMAPILKSNSVINCHKKR